MDIEVSTRNFGARGDAKILTDGEIAAGSNELTSASAAFTENDIGKKLMIRKAGVTPEFPGATPLPLSTRIAGFIGPNRVRLADNSRETFADPKRATLTFGTDDTLAINSAIRQVERAGGGRVVLPPGTYGTSSNVSITTSNVVLEGAGVGATVITPVALWTRQADSAPVQYPGLVGIQHNDANRPQPERITIKGIKFVGALANVNPYYDVPPWGAGEDHNEPFGINGGYADHVTVEGCEFRDFGSAAIWPGGGANFWTVTRNHFYNCGIATGLPTTVQVNGDDWVVSDNTLEKVYGGIGVSFERATVTGNIIKDAWLGGIAIGENEGGEGSVVVGNTIVLDRPRVSSGAINLYSTSNVVVANNTIEIILDPSTAAQGVNGIGLVHGEPSPHVEDGREFLRTGTLISDNTVNIRIKSRQREAFQGYFDGQFAGITVTHVKENEAGDAVISNNSVTVTGDVNPNRAQYGIVGSVGGAALPGQITFKLLVKGNVVRGVPNNEALRLYEYYAQVHRLDYHAFDNIVDGGHVRLPNPAIDRATGQISTEAPHVQYLSPTLDNTPFYASRFSLPKKGLGNRMIRKDVSSARGGVVRVDPKEDPKECVEEAIELTGRLPGDVIVELPQITGGSYNRWIWNHTTNNHAVSVKVARGDHNISIEQGKAAWVMCDGTSIRKLTTDATP